MIEGKSSIQIIVLSQFRACLARARAGLLTSGI
jgi:hypothetical protein